MNDPLVLQFHRAAGQRISAARVLSAAAETLDAMYLGGYGLECSLKALILASTPPNRRRELMEETFRGQLAHNLDHLTYLIVRNGISIPAKIRTGLRRCFTIWYVELRYETGRRPATECRTLLDTAEQVWVWTGRKIQ
jgi:hypothetical protein